MTLTSLDGLPAPAGPPDRRRPWLRAGLGAHGVRPGRRSRPCPWDPVKGAEWTLTLSRDDVPIRGRLLDPEGRPLAGASVRLTGLYVPWKRDLSAHLEKQKSPNAIFMPIDYDRSLDTPGVLPGVATEAVTDADGRFRFKGLGRDRLARLSIRGPGIADTSIVVMTRDAADVHARPLGAPEDLVTYGASFTLSAGTGPDRDGRGARQGVGYAARGCLGWPRDRARSPRWRRATIPTPPTRKAGSPSRVSPPISRSSITRR